MEALNSSIKLIDVLLQKVLAEAESQKKAQQASNQVSKVQNTSGNKKSKEKNNAKASSSNSEVVASEHEYFLKAKIKVARVMQVEEVEGSDKLYKCQIDLGDEQRQVVAGLKKYLSVEELQNQLVVCVCNLKPAKLAGQTSEAMIMASEVQDGDNIIVKTLIPPDGSKAGDDVGVEGFLEMGSSVKQMKSDHWKKVMEQLRVKEGKACHAGVPLITCSGPVRLPNIIPDGAIIK
eukprot:TRINITY_DN6163_c0_g1_i1.p1 TRINITY_DN6163_c0_g1~~TRINITY_DN6163_c0_g1_i1.p1  ORF type:complete len:234 (+),score=34.21 TRINITY_DN6163_c0_g1_i1:77-778(+)